MESERSEHRERVHSTGNGYLMLALGVLVAGLFYVYTIQFDWKNSNPLLYLFSCGFFGLIEFVLVKGLYTLQPNEAVNFLLFGAYRGTDRLGGLRWVNPLYTKHKLSLRARNLNGDKLKVNDKRGSPIEIAAVVIWRVSDPARAAFDVENYEEFVRLQGETAVRHLAASYAYDAGENGAEEEVTLRGCMEQIEVALKQELCERLAVAGVTVDEARLTHLAYAPEIAQMMLRRQQAEAVIAARQKIVTGAVSMVDAALRALSEGAVIDLDPERRASMVSNLMVVLCADSDVQPVINAGTLYS